MRDHVKILGILQIVLGALGGLVALAVLAVFGLAGAAVGTAAVQQDPDAILALPIFGGIGMALFILILILSLPSIFAGVGLLQMRPWARILTIVLCALNLLNVPIGTAIGIYGLWVMLNKETEQMFRGVASTGPTAGI
jgi:hypothetical protein